MSVLFTLLKGDPVLPVLRDAARWAREHNQLVSLCIGGREYLIHPQRTGDGELLRLLDVMEADGAVVPLKNAGRRGALPVRGAP